MLAAQAHRMAGNHQPAFDLTLQAESIFEQDEGVILNHFFVRMMHQHNALELSKANPEHAQAERLAQQARAFFVEHLDKGYGCLRGVVRELS